MDIVVISIIVLRLTVPLLILRLPLTGLLCAAALDIVDFSILGPYTWYQPVDKLLDLYYLALCLVVALKTWPDTTARHWAVGLFAWRTLGVGLLLIGAPEWSLILFPNVFEMLFGFYLLYRSWSGSPLLFRRGRDTAIILSALVIPKLLQEYSLHVAPFTSLPYTAWVLPQGIEGVVLWLMLPLTALWWYIRQAPNRHLPSSPLGRVALPVRRHLHLH